MATDKQINFLSGSQDQANPLKYFAVKFKFNGTTYDIIVEDLATNQAPSQAANITSAGIAAGGGGGGTGNVVGPAGATNDAIVRYDGVTGLLIQDSLITISDLGALSLPDGVRQVFNPDATIPGLNVGAQAGDPSTPINGDVWYDSTGNLLRARINGATVSLGAGGGGTPGGSTTQLQFNNAGAFGGISGATTDGAATTFSSGTMIATRPRFVISIDDINGNELIDFGVVGAAVNQVRITNAATGNPAIISATGGDTNIGLTLTPKGTGIILASSTISSPGAGAQSERFGASSTASGSFATAYGNSSAAGGDQSIALGWNSIVNGANTGAIVVGAGSGITAASAGAIVIGNAAGTGTGGATGANSISIGIGSLAPTANTIVFGGSTQPINVLYGGKGELNATPVLFTVSGTHGSGANVNGADLAFQAGAGTGTGVSGAIIFKTAPIGASSSVRNALVECARFNSNGVLTFPTTITAPGTTGNQTINKQSGVVNIAAAGTSVTVTNSLVTANSYVFAEIRTLDATARIASVVPSAGSFVINIVATTLEIAIQWFILNP